MKVYGRWFANSPSHEAIDRERRKVGGIRRVPSDIEDKVREVVEKAFDEFKDECLSSDVDDVDDFVIKRIKKAKHNVTQTLSKKMKGFNNLKYVKDKDPKVGYTIEWVPEDTAKIAIDDILIEAFEWIKEVVFTYDRPKGKQRDPGDRIFLLIAECEQTIRNKLFEFIKK